ncbi:hypothetical protein QBC46DRAFT_363015 [Diplogelasinospora grovesii]|uniref:Uncharacterized protein n=1 Tax=Diplogelasinospora grovesii TaxID=303347 RepID=A0AAN6NA46_9PEZI|nr:hypothetical protein QBC46DRAFT_363015 [Diplogelasinospora grovesii]
MSANPNSVGGQGQFHSSVPPAEPRTRSGHQLGQQVGNEAENTFRPNPSGEIPGQALNPDVDPSTRTGALDMPGSTSQQVYNQTQYGKPVQGETTKRERRGLERVGATKSKETVESTARDLGADLPEGVERGVRGKTGSEEGGYAWPGAEHQQPATAEDVAAERP